MQSKNQVRPGPNYLADARRLADRGLAIVPLSRCYHEDMTESDPGSPVFSDWHEQSTSDIVVNEERWASDNQVIGEDLHGFVVEQGRGSLQFLRSGQMPKGEGRPILSDPARAVGIDTEKSELIVVRAKNSEADIRLHAMAGVQPTTDEDDLGTEVSSLDRTFSAITPNGIEYHFRGDPWPVIDSLIGEGMLAEGIEVISQGGLIVGAGHNIFVVDENADVMPVPEWLIAARANVEAASFVSPKWVPQMADGAEVMAGIARRPGTIYSVLVPNLRGFEGALAARADEVVIFGAASEAFSQRNINCSIAESIARFEPVAAAAKAAGLRLRGSISCSLGCPYQGETPVAAVVDVAERFLRLGCDEIDVADTIGVGTAAQVGRVLRAVGQVADLGTRVSGHFHDTYGQALANILAALECGVRIFHSSVAGLGGCPYAKGATGNVATEDVLYLLRGQGLHTGVDLDAVVDIGQWISERIGRPTSSRAGRALALKKA